MGTYKNKMKYIYVFALLFVANVALCVDQETFAVAKITGLPDGEGKAEKTEFVSDDKKTARAPACVVAPKREVKCYTLDEKTYKAMMAACEKGEDFDLKDFGFEAPKRVSVSASASVKVEHKAPEPVMVKLDELPKDFKLPEDFKVPEDLEAIKCKRKCILL